MHRVILGIVIFLLIASCTTEKINGQQKSEDSLVVNKPQTKIIVNKEYDESGNLVKFDSSYSCFYSNLESDLTFSDSSFSHFQEQFFNSFPNIQKPFFNDMFFEDSLLNYDFYKDEFFSNRFKLNRQKLDGMFEKMDSLKNKFYKNFSEPNSSK